MTSSASTEMPFLDHLEELRWRLIRAIGALAVGFGVAFFLVVHYDVIGLLQSPILPYLHGHKLIVTHPTDTFSITLTISFILGIALALPVILYQIWAFLSPALYKHEKRVVLPVLLGAALLFAAGVALAWFVVLPLSLSFLMTFQTSSLDTLISASEYFGFATTMALIFGAVFELPIAIVLLTALGVVQPAMLAQFRRYAIVIIWGAAAIITPGDFLGTTAVLSVALYLLYELSIVLSWLVYRRRMRKEAEVTSGEEAIA